MTSKPICCIVDHCTSGFTITLFITKIKINFRVLVLEKYVVMCLNVHESLHDKIIEMIL